MHAALVLFNYLLAFESTSKRALQPELERAMKSIGEVLSNTQLADKDTIVALLVCECRLLYKNHDLVTWV